MLRCAIFLVCFSLFVGLSVADASIIVSGDGDELVVEVAGSSVTPFTPVAISVHPVWQPNDPNGLGAVWVSFDDTGQPGTVSVPNSTTTPAMVVEETISVGPGGAILDLDVWADDTAGVFIDGTSVFTPNFVQDGACADGAIACEVGEAGMINEFLAEGTHTLRFEVYQVGGGPFGLLYSAEINAVPEPTTLVIWSLLATLGLSFYRRRRRRAF